MGRIDSGRLNGKTGWSIESIAAISEETAASAEQITSVDEQQRAIQVVTESATKLNDEINVLKQAIDKFTL